MELFARFHLLISTHALTEGDGTPKFFDTLDMAFQLTPSQRATNVATMSVTVIIHFNSRPHRGRPTPGAGTT